MNPIDCKWVYIVKLYADDTLDKLKAKLVRLKWDIQHVDINNALLNDILIGQFI